MEGQAVVNNQIQQQPVKPATPKSNYWIIGGIILVLLLLFGAIFALSLPSRKPVSLPPKPLASLPPTSPTPDPTANWKTYIGKEGGFLIQYPSDYSIRIRDDLVYGAGPAVEIYSSSGFNIVVVAAQNTENLSLDKPRGLFGAGPLIRYDTEEPLPEGVTIKQVTLGGIKAFRIDHCCGGETGIEAEIKTIKDNKIYDIEVTPDSKYDVKYYDYLRNPENKRELDQILSTFKFTSASPTGGDQNQTVCTQDAKMCPDGKTYVGRRGPNCEFAKCP